MYKVYLYKVLHGFSLGTMLLTLLTTTMPEFFIAFIVSLVTLELIKSAER